MRDLTRQMRSLIRPQILVVKKVRPVACHWCQKEVTPKDLTAQVDHWQPLFAELRDRFLHEQPPTTTWKVSWQQYHQQHATLKLLHLTCHQQKTRGDLITLKKESAFYLPAREWRSLIKSPR